MTPTTALTIQQTASSPLKPLSTISTLAHIISIIIQTIQNNTTYTNPSSLQIIPHNTTTLTLRRIFLLFKSNITLFTLHNITTIMNQASKNSISTLLPPIRILNDTLLTTHTISIRKLNSYRQSTILAKETLSNIRIQIEPTPINFTHYTSKFP